MTLVIKNDHASLVAHSAILDRAHMALVAAVLPSTDAQLLKAIKASLSTNSKSSMIQIIDLESNIRQLCISAQRGYLQVTRSFAALGAKGSAVCLLHPDSDDPREAKNKRFYVVANLEENVFTKAIDRLNLVLPWPLLPAWGPALIGQALNTPLAEMLDIKGPGWSGALRLDIDAPAWGQLVSNSVKEGRLPWLA